MYSIVYAMVYLPSMRYQRVGGMAFIHLRIAPGWKLVISFCLSRKP